MNRKSHIICLLVVSDCSTLSFLIFLRKVFGRKPQISRIHVCRACASRLQKSVLSARAPSTTSTYHRAFKRWKDFAVSNLKGNYLLANPIHVAVYLQHVLESTKSCSSVDSAFYAIKWAHEIAGMASPTDNQVVS